MAGANFYSVCSECVLYTDTGIEKIIQDDRQYSVRAVWQYNCDRLAIPEANSLA